MAKSDVLLNNICEVFNGKLVGGRYKPIIATLEFAREYLMKRIVNVNKPIDRFDGTLTPTATKILTANSNEARKYTVDYAGDDLYQAARYATKTDKGKAPTTTGGVPKKSAPRKKVIKLDDFEWWWKWWVELGVFIREKVGERGNGIKYRVKGVKKEARDLSSRDNVKSLGTTLKCETPNEVLQDGSEEEPSYAAGNFLEKDGSVDAGEASPYGKGDGDLSQYEVGDVDLPPSYGGEKVGLITPSPSTDVKERCISYYHELDHVEISDGLNYGSYAILNQRVNTSDIISQKGKVQRNEKATHLKKRKMKTVKLSEHIHDQMINLM
nr:transposase, mutator type [Tanacetum cinerariifolium]